MFFPIGLAERLMMPLRLSFAVGTDGGESTDPSVRLRRAAALSSRRPLVRSLARSLANYVTVRHRRQILGFRLQSDLPSFCAGPGGKRRRGAHARENHHEEEGEGGRATAAASE